MALVVMQRARMGTRDRARRGVGLAGTLLAAGLWLVAPVAHAAEDEFVPGGAWNVRVMITQEHQDSAIATDGQLRPLADWLMHKPGLSEQLSGGVTRDVTTTETLIGFGISDTWNLNLTLPYKVIRQTSTLRTSSTDPLALAAVDQLKTETVSGMGNVRLMSLHRPLFSDTTSIILGWGYSMPGARQQNDYVGKATLDPGLPYHSVDGLFHYTAYPQGASRSRFDIRLAFDLGLQSNVKTPTDKSAPLNPGNAADAMVRWEQELDPVGYGVYLRSLTTTASTLDGNQQRDPTQEVRLGVEVLWGNMALLEEKPIRLPYQAGFQVDHMIRGFNVPLSTRYTLFARLYF